MKYKSIASWPANAGIGISEDTHDTREQAQAVCDMLQNLGLGGEGKIYPLATEVREIPVLVSWERKSANEKGQR
jgi:hypothetical protein